MPKSGGSDNIALKIARPYIGEKEVLECDMPMIKDREQLNRYHDRSAETIGRFLDSGKTVAFLTLGDPAIYSTVMYVHRRLTEKGYDTAMVQEFLPLWSCSQPERFLCERDETLHIIPATFKGEEAASLTGTRVLMKSGKTIMEQKERLAEKKAMMVECATMENRENLQRFR